MPTVVQRRAYGTLERVAPRIRQAIVACFGRYVLDALDIWGALHSIRIRTSEDLGKPVCFDRHGHVAIDAPKEENLLYVCMCSVALSSEGRHDSFVDLRAEYETKRNATNILWNETKRNEHIMKRNKTKINDYETKLTYYEQILKT